MGNHERKKQLHIKSLTFLLEALFLLALIIYPMRHVTWGGDLWDVGYNYGNFRFGNMESMGKMWFFSTYLSNAVGHFLTLLPFGHTVMGLNVYTALFASLLAVMGYLFCTRTLHVPKLVAFVGEWTALSLCWCPTALLYNYITYVLFSLSCILLYHGLTFGRKRMLFLAGICLGANVFVRFSNLPEMGLILSVWCFDFWQGWEKRKENAKWSGEMAGKMLRDTLLCLAGYLGALAAGFAWIGFRYGLENYAEGIRLLFSMTDTATDYKPASMIYGLLWPFKEGLHWVKNILVFVLAAVLIVTGMDYAPLCFEKGGKKISPKAFRRIGMLGGFLMAVVMVYWLFLQREDPAPNFTTYFYTSYDPIFWPGTLFLMLALVLGAVDVFRRGSRREERFWGLTMILVVILTSLGSNNGLYPSFNHLFLAAPYVLWRAWLFTKWSFRRAETMPSSLGDLRLNLRSVAIMLWAFLLVCLIQFCMFGALFSFCEGTGQQEKGYLVENNKVLKGIGMSSERAGWIRELSQYAEDAKLQGREVILHGGMPALAFYLEMPPAFHSWNDLASFGVETMEKTLEEKEKSIWLEYGMGGEVYKAGDWPVVIAEKKYASYEKGIVAESERDAKWELILDFMEEFGERLPIHYKIVFENEKFVIWEAVPAEENERE